MTRATDTKLELTVRARIWSLGADSWKVADGSDSSEHVRECSVHLSIQGSETHGYNLVMTPEGLFTADYWYHSLDEAFESAAEIFGAERSAWRELRAQ